MMSQAAESSVLRWKNEHDASEVESARCPLCGADDPSLVAHEWGLRVVSCRPCGLIYVSPRLRDSGRNYWDDAEVKRAKYAAILAGTGPHPRDDNYREHLEMIARHRRSGSLLDVGTHCGFFLRMARGRGWDLSGVEASESSAQIAREAFGLNVRAGLLEQAGFGDASFDVVTLVDVLEHVSDPASLLREIRRVLKDDGVLFIKVPNASYNKLKLRVLKQWARMQRFDIFDAREHVVHYTIETLSRMLAGAGLDVVELYVPRPIQSGAAWQKAARSTLYHAARLLHRSFGVYSAGATDIAVVATPRKR
jgi:2-polyprenyl-3-methyl-5-hydroxy-6-metoxy-1,4-benzoquinol methylase